MEIGELGLPTELAVSVVEEVLKLTPEFVIALHQQMEELYALDCLLKVFLATHSFVQ
jgi:hypothetical protein